MTTDELWTLISGELTEIKADQKETCRLVKDLNGRVLKNSWSLRAIWSVFGLAWAGFLVWMRARLQ